MRATIREEVTGAALPAISHRPGTRVHRLEDPKVPVQLVLSRIVADRPAGADRDRKPADADHDAIGAAQELHQIIDQIGIVEVNRCHCRRRAPSCRRGRISHCDRNQGRVNWMFVQAVRIRVRQSILRLTTAST
jgi:hypothetical protein